MTRPVTATGAMGRRGAGGAASTVDRPDDVAVAKWGCATEPSGGGSLAL